jgi:hypothetical protein
MIPTFILSKDSLLYRSYTDKAARIGAWFSTDPTETYGYGVNTGEFKVLRELKILDLSNKEFYNTFIRDLDKLIVLNPHLEQLKPQILFPLGFDDRLFYREFAKEIGLDLSNIKLVPYVHVLSNLKFNNRSRCSIHQLDTFLFNIIKGLYESSYDGIGCLEKYPDVLRNGFHHKELMIFKPSDVEYSKDIPRIIMGGSKLSTDIPLLTAISLDSEYIRETTKLFNEIVSSDTFVLPTTNTNVIHKKKGRRTRKQFKNIKYN